MIYDSRILYVILSSILNFLTLKYELCILIHSLMHFIMRKYIFRNVKCHSTQIIIICDRRVNNVEAID